MSTAISVDVAVDTRSTLDRHLVNCRSHISRVLIWSETKSSTNYGHGNLFFFQFVSSPIVWYLAVTQDQSGPKLNLWLAYLKLFPHDAMPLSWKWAFRNTHQFFWALTCFIIPGSRFCGDHKCKLYVSALKAGTVHWLVRFKWEQQSV